MVTTLVVSGRPQQVADATQYCYRLLPPGGQAGRGMRVVTLRE
jgi:hypothetical protein